MRLANIMTQKIMCVSPDDSLDKAICLMDEHYIHHLPVLDHTKLVGMLSDRDLLIAVGWKLECERRPLPNSGVVGPQRIRDTSRVYRVTTLRNASNNRPQLEQAVKSSKSENSHKSTRITHDT
jgi:CBS-domain-containing membrane protein